LFLFRWYRRLGLLVLLVAAAVAASIWLFVFPRTDAPGRADAVVVLSGAKAERLDRALEMMRAHTAPLLVISDGRNPEWPQANRLCAGHTTFRVLCFKPDPYSTRGEAEAIAVLARTRGWRAVDVVTSRYHVFRARMIVRRCYHGGLRMIASTPSLGDYALGAVQEWPKLAVALLVRRAC